MRSFMTEEEWMEHEGEWWIPEPNTGCWLWNMAVSTGGYGRVPRKMSDRLAHRIAYKALKDFIPADKEIDHICCVRSCVNPDHMRVVTRRFNVLRGNAASAICARRDCCAKGHPYAVDNLYVDKHGTRLCVTCRREYSRQQY